MLLSLHSKTSWAGGHRHQGQLPSPDGQGRHWVDPTNRRTWAKAARQARCSQLCLRTALAAATSITASLFPG